MEVKDDNQLKCVSCGQSAYLEPNFDKSYIMCMYCMREYTGGYEELYLLNKEKVMDERMSEF